MNHQQVVRTWAKQLKTKATGCNVFFVERTIYSYVYHFPMAHITAFEYHGQPIILRNSDSYSVSTAKHQSFVRRETWDSPVIEVNTKTLKAMIDELSFERHITPVTKSRAIVEIRERIAYATGKHDRARLHKDMWMRDIVRDKVQLKVLESLPCWQGLGREEMTV